MLLLSCLLILPILHLAIAKDDFANLKVASFNVQAFGTAKVADTNVVKYLVKIIQRYDIILIQEIRDNTETAIQTLLNKVNAKDDLYGMTVSRRLGRTNSKEQYAYIYRKDRIRLKDTYVYSDRSDVFEREPYVAHFKWKTTEFFMIGIHTSPSKAPREMNKLPSVYNSAKSKFKTDDGIILGDFNADCNYITNAEWKRNVLAKDKRLFWLINDDVDTTTGRTNCAYDRFVVAGRKMVKMVLPSSAKPFKFEESYGLDKSSTQKISDHYPIEMELAHVKLRSKFKNSKSITIYHPESGKLSKQKIFASRRDSLGKRIHKVNTYYTATGAVSSFAISLECNGKRRLQSALASFGSDFSEFVTQSQQSTILLRLDELSTYNTLKGSDGHYQTHRDYYMSLSRRYTLSLECTLNDSSCFIKISLVEM